MPVHAVFSASHDGMLDGHDDLPPFSGNSNPKAERRESFKEASDTRKFCGG
jgi:hypothetical protein